MEALFLHQGQVTFPLGDRRAVLAPGATVYVPPSSWWGAENRGSETATMVILSGQPEVEPCFRKGILELSPETLPGWSGSVRSSSGERRWCDRSFE